MAKFDIETVSVKDGTKKVYRITVNVAERAAQSFKDMKDVGAKDLKTAAILGGVIGTVGPLIVAFVVNAASNDTAITVAKRKFQEVITSEDKGHTVDWNQ